jgi:hypothetical protein
MTIDTISSSAKTAYKSKTAVIGSDELLEPGEVYSLEVNQYLFRGRVRPGQMLIMRKGCLAAVGDIVQVASSDSLVCEVAEYQDGVGYSAVCVASFISDDLPQGREKALPKQYHRVVYIVNNVKRYSPWFNSIANAFKAKEIVMTKYDCEADVYFSYCPSSELCQAHHEATRHQSDNGGGKDLIDIYDAAYEAALCEVKKIEAEMQNEQNPKLEEPIQ